jgi:hypothetical protein
MEGNVKEIEIDEKYHQREHTDEYIPLRHSHYREIG